MTRDQVIEAAKDWHFLISNMNYDPLVPHPNVKIQEARDVHKACVDLAFNKTKEALTAYAKEREKQFAEHDRMLDSIEAALQQEFKNGV